MNCLLVHNASLAVCVVLLILVGCASLCVLKSAVLICLHNVPACKACASTTLKKGLDLRGEEGGLESE